MRRRRSVGIEWTCGCPENRREHKRWGKPWGAQAFCATISDLIYAGHVTLRDRVSDARFQVVSSPTSTNAQMNVDSERVEPCSSDAL